MRWKLLRRKLSVAAPRVIVRSYLPWPVRWAAAALVLGFSGAIALWAFELGKDIAGLDREAKIELLGLRQEIVQLRKDRDQAQALAHTADSLLKAERAAQDKLAQQVRQLESDKLALQADLGFFERLLPASGSDELAVRALQVEAAVPGRLRYQLLVMQNRKGAAAFAGRYELTLAGTLDGRPWSLTPASGARELRLNQYARLEGEVEHPPAAVVKTVQVRVTDAGGALRATQTVRM